MSTVIIGVDASERSEDAVAFGRRIADASGANVIVACAYPYSDVPTRGDSESYRRALADEAKATARTMRDRLEGIPEERIAIRVLPNTSPAHALHDLAEAERATLVVVGSTHTGRVGRVLPGSTGERLLHGAPCSVAVVPKGYREHADEPLRRIGVAYNGTDESRAAAHSAAALARAFDAELEVIGVIAPESYGAPALMGGPSVVILREDIEHHVQESLDAMVAELGDGLNVRSVRLTGPPSEMLVTRSRQLDLLVTGSRGYGPLRAVLAGGVSGRVMRNAECPVIIVPRGIEAPLSTLFGDTATAAA